jgi:hypothetical protein
MRPFGHAAQSEIEMLLPWYAAGTLDRRTIAEIAAALAHDVELRRQCEFVCDELSETIHLNESLGVPTTRASERLTAMLAAEIIMAPRRKATLARWRGSGKWRSELSPRVLKWSATVAALALLLHVALISDTRGIGHFWLSTVPDGKLGNDAYAFVGFAPQATSTDITTFLHAHRAQIVEGPHVNGIYKIRIEGALPEADVTAILQNIRQPNDLLRFIGMTSK